jgi:hypothetical protein
MASLARIRDAIERLNKELRKLDPKTRKTLLDLLEIIQTEIREYVGEVIGPFSGPNWIDPFFKGRRRGRGRGRGRR